MLKRWKRNIENSFSGRKKKSILFPVLSPELQEPPDPHITVLLAKDIDHTMNQTNTTGISQHSTTRTLIPKTSDTVRHISSCATNCCNSTACIGRLIIPAENLGPAPDIFMVVAVLELTRREQLWWILGSFQHLNTEGFTSVAFMLLSGV